MGRVGAGAGDGTEGAPISSPGRLALRPAQSYRSLCTSQSLHFPLTLYVSLSLSSCGPPNPLSRGYPFSTVPFPFVIFAHLCCVNSTPEEWSGAGGQSIAAKKFVTSPPKNTASLRKLAGLKMLLLLFFPPFFPLVLSHSFLQSGKKPNKKHRVKH